MRAKALRGWMQCRSRSTRFEIKRSGVDAIAEAGGAGAVGEDVAEVGVALGAAHFDAAHAVAGVFDGAQGGVRHRFEVTRPAAAGIELRGRVEQGRGAADAAVDAVLVVVPILAGKRPLGA